MKSLSIASCAAVIAISFAAHAGEIRTSQVQQAEPASVGYMPGMGEIMGATQMRHAKLWFAGNAKNWKLASYEVDEIEEGLADAAKYHPVFKKNAPISAMLEKFVKPPINDIRRAIEVENIPQFRTSYDALTTACNACHQAAGQEFIVIKRPDILQFSNQDFSVK